MSLGEDSEFARGVIAGREAERTLHDSCDAVVVGSGSGGAVAAAILAQAGFRVIVLEEGPFFRSTELESFQPTQTVRRVFRQAGMSVALGLGQTPMIALTVGRAVGGSSLLTGGVCFRVPEQVHDHWEKRLGLSNLSMKAFETAYDDVERELAVTEVPSSLRSRSTQLYVDGAKRLGIDVKPIRRNTSHDCEGNGLCTFGCPKSAKRSVNISYLPKAVAHGAQIYSDALVEHLDIKNGRVTGVRGRFLRGRDSASVGFRVRAKVVVVACGTLHTPLLLGRARLGKKSGQLGKGITLHPALRIVSRFDDAVNGWDGALQSVYADAEAGIKLVGVYTAVNLLAAGMPGVGPMLRKRIRELGHCAVFGAMIHDEGSGRLWPIPGREGLLTYRMSPRDRERLKRATSLLVRLSLESGAREVYPPILGAAPITSLRQAAALETDPLDMRRMECLAFHPLGSARMAAEATQGVVASDGEAFGVKGLFVADGSVLPTSVGVNSQVPIMAMATKIAWGIADRL